MLSEDFDWSSVPGAEHEDAELRLGYEKEVREADALRFGAQEYVKRYDAQELGKRLIAERAASERGPLSSRVRNMAGVRELKMPKHLIRDVLYTGSVAIFLGDSQVGKSWVLQAIAACAASGLNWPDMHPSTKGRLPVLYVAAEDGGSIKMRLEHWERAHTRRIPDETFHALAEPVDLLDEVTVDEIISFVIEYQIRLVIIDTISASLGGQEETNEAFARLVRHGRRIALAMQPHGGGSVAFAHHFGKDKEKGGRGGSSLFNDSDIVWELTGDIDAIKLTNKKWKVDEKRRHRNLRLNKGNRDAVHITEYRETGDSINLPEDPMSVLERTIIDIIREHHDENSGYGLNSTDIRGMLPLRGVHTRSAVITEKLASMVLERKLLKTQRGRARLYRLPPVQEEIPTAAPIINGTPRE